MTNSFGYHNSKSKCQDIIQTIYFRLHWLVFGIEYLIFHIYLGTWTFYNEIKSSNLFVSANDNTSVIFRIKFTKLDCMNIFGILVEEITSLCYFIVFSSDKITPNSITKNWYNKIWYLFHKLVLASNSTLRYSHILNFGIKVFHIEIKSPHWIHYNIRLYK